MILFSTIVTIINNNVTIKSYYSSQQKNWSPIISYCIMEYTRCVYLQLVYRHGVYDNNDIRAYKCKTDFGLCALFET